MTFIRNDTVSILDMTTHTRVLTYTLFNWVKTVALYFILKNIIDTVATYTNTASKTLKKVHLDLI